MDTPNNEDKGYGYVEYVHNEIIKRVPSKAVYAFREDSRYDVYTQLCNGAEFLVCLLVGRTSAH